MKRLLFALAIVLAVVFGVPMLFVRSAIDASHVGTLTSEPILISLSSWYLQTDEPSDRSYWYTEVRQGGDFAMICDAKTDEIKYSITEYHDRDFDLERMLRTSQVTGEPQRYVSRLELDIEMERVGDEHLILPLSIEADMEVTPGGLSVTGVRDAWIGRGDERLEGGVAALDPAAFPSDELTFEIGGIVGASGTSDEVERRRSFEAAAYEVVDSGDGWTATKQSRRPVTLRVYELVK